MENADDGNLAVSNFSIFPEAKNMKQRAIYIGPPLEREEEGQYLGFGATGIVVYSSKTASVFRSDNGIDWYPDIKNLYFPKG